MLYDVITNSFYLVISGLTFYKMEETVLHTLVSVVASVHVIKMIVKKPRPDESDHYSFPSGHSAVAWFFVILYQWNPIVFVWAILVTMSRVAKKRHDEIDVTAGTLLGILISSLRLTG